MPVKILIVLFVIAVIAMIALRLPFQEAPPPVGAPAPAREQLPLESAPVEDPITADGPAEATSRSEVVDTANTELLLQLQARLDRQDEKIAALQQALELSQERLHTLEGNVDIFEPHDLAPGEFEDVLSSLELSFETDQTAGEFPSGWGRCGPKGPHEVVADDQHSYSGRYSTRISNADAEAKGFGGVLSKLPHKYVAGKRIRYSGYLKTEGIQGAASLWFRADGGAGAFNNMMMKEEDIVSGTQDWTRFSFDLDIPQETHNINFGAFLSGSGTMWVDDLDVEILGPVQD